MTRECLWLRPRFSTQRVNHNSFWFRGYLHVLRRTGFFSRLGARSVALQRRAYAQRAARRRVQWAWYVHNVFTEPTGRKSVPARAKRRRTRTRIALLTVHNSSSCFLCPWHRACAASPCLPRPCKVAPCFETWCMDPLDTSAAPVYRFDIHAGATHARNAWLHLPKLPFLDLICKSADWKDIYRVILTLIGKKFWEALRALLRYPLRCDFSRVDWVVCSSSGWSA